MRKQDYNTQAARATVESLRETINPHLDLPKARMTCFLMLVLAVIRQRTVSLVWLAKNTTSSATVDSIYRRFQRFFATCILKPVAVGRLILSFLPRPPEGWVLAMDRTNWQFGKSHINILVVSVIHGAVGYPIAWRVLPKSTGSGNSRKFHRIAVMESVLSILPETEIHALTMDREFIGKGWLSWLNLMGVSYVVRLKKNARVGEHPAEHLAKHGRWKKLASLRQVVFGQKVYFTAKRINKGRDPWLMVISNSFNGCEALSLYQKRWGIETLFGHLKKRGYQFEETHMTRGPRISKLLGVLAVAFAFCHRWGRKLEEEKGIKLKKHGYRAKSLFRQGLESLHCLFAQPIIHAKRLAEFFEVILRKPLAENFVV
mgnify:FL=1